MIRKFYIDDATDAGGGGGGNGPAAPKGYVPTTPDQRSQWNGFLDYAGKQGADLTDPKAQASLMTQYKKANPAFSITAEQIPAIQYEAYQIRKGDQFGKLGAKELGYIRQGLSPNFINADTNNIAKLYYPQMASHGTDIEGYYNSKFNPSAAQPVVQPGAATANPNVPNPTSQATASRPGIWSTEAQPTAAAPADRTGTIPLPNMEDPKSRLNYLHQMAQTHGAFVHGRGDYILDVGKVPYQGTVPIAQSAASAAKKVGLDPALLYSSSMEEGVSGLFPDEKGLYGLPEHDENPDYPIDGYANFGLDNFHGNFKEMVKRGYLPKDLDYKPFPTKNEQGAKVVSALFKNPEDAMQAKAAYVRMEQDNLDDWAKKQGDVKLSPAARQFFTLIAFNGGPGRAHVLINYYKKKGLLEGDKFLQQAPDKSADPGGSYGNVLPRIQMADLLKKEKLI